MKKTVRTAFALILILVFVITSFSGGCNPFKFSTKPHTAKETEGAYQPASPAQSTGVTGTISTGAKVDMVTTTVSPSGGTVAVVKPGDPLDGLQIEVPAGAYIDSRTFKVSSAPITGQTFGSGINPVSPMISVDNGGGYSNEMMYVRVPINLPKGYFAMGFLYDENSKQLEGMPLVAVDADSVTVATRHFSNFLISMIFKTALNKDIDSNFRPGIDDWQFENTGSYIAPDGHCEGQSFTAMWYYCTKPDGKGAHLHDRYDNNGNKPPTPALWEDDSLGYRFCSTIQNGFDGMGAYRLWHNLAGKAWDEAARTFIDVPGINDEATWDLFAYSMQETGEPQSVAIMSNTGSKHAMICYRVTRDALYVADPNYPGGDTRKIEYAGGKFKPYQSGANKQEIDTGNSKAYEKIIYWAKTTVVTWDKIAQRWGEFKAGTIGTGTGLFPAYTLMVVNATGQRFRLTDGLITAEPELSVMVDGFIPWELYLYEGIVPSNIHSLWHDTTKNLPKITLKPGKNLLGFYVRAIPPNNTDYKYVDFRWVNVYLQTLTIVPDDLSGQTNQDYIFTARMDNPPDWVEYEWYLDGAQKQSGKENQFSYKFNKENTYNISVRLRDPASGGYMGEASAVANIYGVPYTNLSITPSNSTGELNKDYKFTAITTNPPGDPIYEWFVDGKSKSVDDKNSTYLKFDMAGRHEIVVTLVDNRAGSTVGRASAVIEITGAGSLNIGSVPAGADIYLNGQKQRYLTNTKFTNIEAGTYTVSLKKAGYKDYSASAIVEAGKSTELWAKLEADTKAPTVTTKSGFDGIYYWNVRETIEISGGDVRGTWGVRDAHRDADHFYPFLEFKGKIDQQGKVSGVVTGINYIFGGTHSGTFTGEVTGDKFTLRWHYDDFPNDMDTPWTLTRK